MEIVNFLDFGRREQLRQWLTEHAAEGGECWVACNRGKTLRDDSIPYVEVVEEALCFGWIDSTLKRLPDGRNAQRLSPRRKGGHWTTLNLQRCADLVRRGLMTSAGMKALPTDYHLRLATADDIPLAWDIIEQAKAQMLREGRKQWDDTYPTLEILNEDVAQQRGYVLTDNDIVVAYAAVVFDGEPAYDHLEGQWLCHQPYVVVHRLAVAQIAQGRGTARFFLTEVERMAHDRGVKSFRIDTKSDNLAMLRVFEHCGFTFCGHITYRHNGNRMAFEKLL